jgi:3-hydroxy acid dehydrogenase/malonic semialdehyde reductase
MKNVESLFVAITGATSGIGEATAYQLAASGKKIFLMGRRKKNLQSVQKKCQNLGSAEVFILDFDLQEISKSKTQKKIQGFLKKNKIEVDVLVNSAGLAKGTELLQDAKPKDWDQMIDTNVKGLLQITQLFLPSIIHRAGHIVNLGSVAGRLVYEGGAVYCATKFAVRAISEGLRMDLKGTGVRVTNIEPGMVNTKFSLVRLGTQQKADAVYADMAPLSAKDIAESICWSLSQPKHVNVQELVIYPTDQASVGQVVRGEKSILNLNFKKIKNKK